MICDQITELDSEHLTLLFSLSEAKVYLIGPPRCSHWIAGVIPYDVCDLRTFARGSEGLSHAVRLCAEEGKTPV